MVNWSSWRRVTFALRRRNPADSFVLHAPLELMARTGLLRYVEPAARVRARQRIVWLAASFDAHEPVVDVAAEDAAAGTTPSARWLRDTLAAGDLDEIDRLAVTLAAGTSAAELVDRRSDLIVARLSAAGHGSMFLYPLPRLLAAHPSAALMASGPHR